MAGSHTRGYQPLPRDPQAANPNWPNWERRARVSETCDWPSAGEDGQGRRALAVFVARLLAVASALRDLVLVRLPVLVCLG